MISEPHHLHPAAMLIEAVKTVRRWVGILFGGGIAALAGSGLSSWAITLILLGVVIVVAGSAVWGFLSWRAITYEVSGGAFRLRQGVLQKNERTIPLDHVQSVDTVQGIIQRVFGVVEVRIETAGGGASQPDASLSALSRESAEALRRGIEGSRREEVETEEESGPAVIRRLSTRELLVAGATSGQIGAAAAIIAAASQLLDNVPNRFLFSQERIRGLVESAAPHWIVVVTILIFVAGLFAWLLAIGGTVLAYAGFTLSRDGDYLYIRRGLLERREATIPMSRIQAVRIVEGVLRQPFGLAMLRVESAGYGEDAGVSTTLFPLLPRSGITKLLEEVAPEFDVEATLEPLPRRALRRYMFRSAIPFVVLAVVIAANLIFAGFEVWPVLTLALIPPGVLYGWARYQEAGWALEEDHLIVRFRRLARTTVIVPRRKLQSRSVSRSPFQRRVDLATFRARVASGSGGSSFGIVDVEVEKAFSLASELGP